MKRILDNLNKVAGIKGSMLVTSGGVTVCEALGPELEEESVAAISSRMIVTSKRGLESIEREGFQRLTLTSAYGRMVFVDIDIAYLVVITRMDCTLGSIVLEIDSAAQKIRQRAKF